jgi:hypothetical protein
MAHKHFDLFVGGENKVNLPEVAICDAHPQSKHLTVLAETSPKKSKIKIVSRLDQPSNNNKKQENLITPQYRPLVRSSHNQEHGFFREALRNYY